MARIAGSHLHPGARVGSVLPAVGRHGPLRWESWRVRFLTRTDADTPFFFLASIAPSKKKEIAGGALRAMIAGTVASFMTACVAGTVPGPRLRQPAATRWRCAGTVRGRPRVRWDPKPGSDERLRTAGRYKKQKKICLPLCLISFSFFNFFFIFWLFCYT